MTNTETRVVESVDSDNSSDDFGEVGHRDNNGTSNPFWADSIAKILKTNKPKGKKTLVLSRAKKLTDVKKDKFKSAGFQVATEDGQVKEEKVKIEDLEVPEVKQTRKRKHEFQSLRVKPNILNKDRERTMAKIATRGVVQLFNAVKMQQRNIDNKLKEAGPLDVRKEKVLKSIDKRTFLDSLMEERSQKVEEETSEMPPVKNETDPVKKEETWNVLRDDFMIGAKLKDWDKEMGSDEDEDNVEAE